MSTATAIPLSPDDVAARIANGRSNLFVAPSSRSAASIIRANVLTLFNGIILACFVVLLALGRWQDALFGISALGNTIIGSVQEFRAKRSLDRLALLHAPLARVHRSDGIAEIGVADVVIDDILVLRAGDQVAADADVTTAIRLQVDESMLTGESDPVDKSTGDTVLSGSIVVSGEGRAIVTRVGADSFANRLSSEAKKFSLVSSELRQSVNRILGWIAWLIGPLSLLVVNAQMVAVGGWASAIETGVWKDAAVSTIASIVAMIPLGLVLMTSIAFAVVAVRLSRSKVLVQELAAVEGLARIDVICLDKTGTLTQGDIVFDAVHLDAAESASTPQGWESVLGWYAAEPDANSTARCLADPFPSRDLPQSPARIPFSSERKWSAVSFASEAAGTWVLGGAEMVFPYPRSGDDPHARLRSQSSALATTGRRTLVLAHADAVMDAGTVAAERLPSDLVPVALLTFRETVRSDAAATLEYFAAQGVGIRIISGDNPQTVAAIARDVGLDAPVGYDARNLPTDPDELAEVLDEHTVFGRVTPAQKREIVLALQRSGHTVAMTGDGVNDALAIKAADIGIAMDSGSAATKAVARIILLDGRFSRLPGVVAEGRQVIANIERVSMLFLTKTAYATALAIVFGILLLEFPFLPRQLSVIDGLTIGIPAFFLALMPNSRRYVPGFLRRSLSFAIPTGVTIAASLAIYAVLAERIGIPTAELRTGSTLILAVVGLWVLTVLSRPVDGWKIVILGAMMIALLVVYTVPIAVTFLEFASPSLGAMLLVIAVSLITIGAIEIIRFTHRRYIRRHGG